MADFLAHLSDPVLMATPVFLLFVAIEILALHVLGHDDNVIGYSVKDTRTSMSMGAVAVVINGVFRVAMLFVFAALYELAPVKFSPHDWWTWVLMLLGQEIIFYAYHRASHRVRIMWAGHQVHHSSEHYNFSTALRQKWTPYFQLPFWSILAFAGIPPWMILTGLSIDLVYQFFVHTEKIRKLPRWFEYVFNTPSHHRVHHGSDQEYLDANYGGILIIWDRMFGSFVPEGKRPTYGLTKNVESYNLLKVGFHEYGSILRDVRAAGSWRDKLGYVFGPPGWQPSAADRTSPVRRLAR
ncbi:sterol desaturase family protein [Amycolatopsis sp. cmx-11-12]|uniref:sterol desaturase family protein n=1 Tax=Amycolatopsis sp. cmx-11-12 TaxID=2785795 RepID=UPI003916FE62